jgi:hypothetical protein
VTEDDRDQGETAKGIEESIALRRGRASGLANGRESHNSMLRGCGPSWTVVERAKPVA